jgi:hypothetical protein
VSLEAAGARRRGSDAAVSGEVCIDFRIWGIREVRSRRFNEREARRFERHVVVSAEATGLDLSNVL